MSILFADEVAAPGGAHTSRMHGPGRNAAALSGPEGVRLTVHRQGHFAFQDDVSRFTGMRVLRVESVRVVLPDVGVRETFGVELLLEILFAHSSFSIRQDLGDASASRLL